MITTIDVQANTWYVNINYDYKNLFMVKYTVRTYKVRSIKSEYSVVVNIHTTMESTE